MDKEETYACKLQTHGGTAAILGVHVTTVRRWIHGGRLPAKRLGKRLFVYGGDLLPRDFDKNKAEDVE